MCQEIGEQQQPGRENRARLRAGRVEAVPVPAAPDQRADEHRDPEHHAEHRGQAEAHGEPGQRGVVHRVRHRLDERDPQPLTRSTDRPRRTPTSVATAAEISPARSGSQRRCTAGSSSNGASDGFSATVTPNSTAASTGRPRRSAIQPATSPTSSNG